MFCFLLSEDVNDNNLLAAMTFLSKLQGVIYMANIEEYCLSKLSLIFFCLKLFHKYFFRRTRKKISVAQLFVANTLPLLKKE